jgi:[ribosomal protein S5]-alanine N-acetyltransferase
MINLMTIDETFANFPVLATPRLILRELGPGDAAAFFAILSHDEVMRFYGSEPHQSVEQTGGFIARLHEWYTQMQCLRWGITRSGDERIIGTCGLFNFDEGYHRAEVGYDLHPDFWGQGIMTEAVGAILTYAFTTMGLHRVEANIAIANERSKVLLLKLGFTYEGNLRGRYVFRDQFEDEHYFGLLADEWHG